MKRSFIATVLVSVLMLIALHLSSTPSNSGQADEIVGKWKLINQPTDMAGNPCPFIPAEMEFFNDKTMSMSNMPGNKMQYKTDLTAEEKQAIQTRIPGLKDMELLIVKPNPQMEWAAAPIAYGYSLDKSRLSLTVPGWSPAEFERAK
ncbi:MAG: hypothetical protein EPN22_00805 [Nitrospirae bacterium]|nr:MAG: hypothetical protein EPN22_00805 [Nitrospirota bacterium]